MMTKGLGKSTRQKKKVIFSFQNWLGFHILGPWKASSPAQTLLASEQRLPDSSVWTLICGHALGDSQLSW